MTARNHTNRSSDVYDANFVEALKQVGWVGLSIRKKTNQNQIIDFYRTNGKLPSQHSVDRSEKTLFNKLAKYTCLSSTMLDKDFRNQIEKIRREINENKHKKNQT